MNRTEKLNKIAAIKKAFNWSNKDIAAKIHSSEASVCNALAPRSKQAVPKWVDGMIAVFDWYESTPRIVLHDAATGRPIEASPLPVTIAGVNGTIISIDESQSFPLPPIPPGFAPTLRYTASPVRLNETMDPAAAKAFEDIERFATGNYGKKFTTGGDNYEH